MFKSIFSFLLIFLIYGCNFGSLGQIGNSNSEQPSNGGEKTEKFSDGDAGETESIFSQITANRFSETQDLSSDTKIQKTISPLVSPTSNASKKQNQLQLDALNIKNTNTDLDATRNILGDNQSALASEILAPIKAKNLLQELPELKEITNISSLIQEDQVRGAIAPESSQNISSDVVRASRIAYCDTLDIYGTDLNTLNQEDIACLTQASEGFYYARWLYDQGRFQETREFLAQFLFSFPQHRMANDLYSNFISPFSKIVSIVNQKILDWYKTNSSLPEFKIASPEKPVLPKPVLYQRGQFETIDEFNNRIADARLKTQRKMDSEISMYNNRIAEYNKKVRYYNLQVENRRRQLKEAIAEVQERHLNQTLIDVLGQPSFSNLRYNPDSGAFFGYLISSQSNLRKPIVFYVPIYVAKRLRNSIEDFRPLIDFAIKNDRLVMEKFLSINDKYTFQAEILSASNFPITESETALIKPAKSSLFSNPRLIDPSKDDFYEILENSIIKVDDQFLEKSEF